MATPPVESPPRPHLARIKVQGFQSLHSVDLELGPLTVIVGPSSSGKSALVRALRALHHNIRGTSFITHGFTKARIVATLHDDTDIVLSRSTVASSKDNAYEIHAPEGFQGDPPPVVFTKLAGEVPEDVRALLPAIPDLTFASQFDKPYLLDSSPGDVARTLASLTNVHVVLNAAREANRRRLAASQTLKTRRSDREAIEARTEEFRALAIRRKAQDSARTLTEQATALHTKIENLRRAIDALDAAVRRQYVTAQTLASLPDTDAARTTLVNAARLRNDVSVLSRTTSMLRMSSQTLEATSAALSGSIPALGPINALSARRDALRTVLLRYRDAATSLPAYAADVHQATAALADAQQVYIHALSAAGVCPTCGQGTADLTTADLTGRTTASTHGDHA